MLGTVAHAECPEVDTALRSAESDLLSFFLADAQRALGTAVDGMACGDPVTPVQVSRYFQAQAMIWSFEEDPRADRAFAASKLGDPEYFNGDYGAEYRARWESAASPSGASADLVLRGRGDGEDVWLDGVVLKKLRAPVGMHLVQVGEGAPRYARAIEVSEDGALTLSLPAAPVTAPVAPAPVPEPAPDPVAPGPVPEPAPDPVAPKPVAGTDLKFQAPLSGMGRSLADAKGQAMSWRADVVPLAKTQASGREALGKLPMNTVGQVGAVAVVGAGAYGTYLFGWERFRGRSQDPAVMTSAMVISGIVAVTGITYRSRLAQQRKKHRIAARDAASRALSVGGRE
ncbi:MAG: hypothetical protein R3F61_07505 [Myxococcota bacterium]